jgi:hypothetical protein
MFPKMADNVCMNDFEKGMASIGQLHPVPFPYSDYPPPNNAWKDAAKSFSQAGNSLRFALNNLLNAERKSKQMP